MKMTPQIKAVIFDMGGVIIKAPYETMADADERLGVEFLTFHKHATAIYHTKFHERLERGDGNISEFFTELASKFPADAKSKSGKSTYDELVDIYTGNQMKVMSMTPNPVERAEMTTLVRELQAAGIKTVLLTNNWFIDEDNATSLILCPIDCYDLVVESCRVRMRKPERRIYDLVLERLSLSADECLFLDDFAANVSAAEDAGIRSIHVHDAASAIQQVRKAVHL